MGCGGPECDDDAGQGSEEIEQNGGRPALDRVLDALADPTCRRICYHVVDAEPTTLEACATAVAARERGCDPGEVPEDELERVKARVYHSKLPRLADLEIIEYDERSGDIRCQHPPPHFEELVQTVCTIETADR